jgi:DNA-directed RNA polymerase II subunit RPB2
MTLTYPQRPIVTGALPRLLGLDAMPTGCNLIVGISTLGGYNQEDSVILNRSSVERGMFAVTVWHTIYEQIDRNAVTGEEEVFYAPTEDTASMRAYNFDKLLPSGFPALETMMVGGDAVIGKYVTTKSGDHADASCVLRSNEYGRLESIVAPSTHRSYAVNGDGYSFCQVRLRDSRDASIGDKVASRSGQKGIVGMVLTQENMPTTADGLVPDLIINPHAMPSRMTVGQLLEGIVGKAACARGAYGDATAFGDSFDLDACLDALSDAGFECHGEDVVYDPRTGAQMDVTMCISPTYYQRLKHMVRDKVHGRGSCGPTVMLTRQPAEGRARDGGLRLGEMEIECLLAHGQIKFLKERFMRCSDEFEVDVCTQCGIMLGVNVDEKVTTCTCGNARNFVRVALPYSMKLMIQEVYGMGIGVRLFVGSSMRAVLGE